MSGKLIPFDDIPVLPVHRKVTIGTFLGQICDGYIIGIVGIALSYAAKDPAVSSILTSYWLGIIGSGVMFGILFGSFIAGAITDRIGRKKMYCSVMIISVILSLCQLLTIDPVVLAVLRFLLGVFIGTDYTVGIALLNECSPEKRQASMLAWLLLIWTLGYTFAYIIGFFMDSLGTQAWRWILASSAVPGFLAILFRFNTPESPRWLVAKGRLEEARAVMNQYFGPQYALPVETEKAASASWFALFAPNQWRKTLVSGIFFGTQVLPFFAIGVFIPLVLEKIGVTNPHATGVLYNVSSFLGVAAGVWLYTKIGRRPFLLWTYYLSAALLTFMVVWKDMPPTLSLICITLFSFILSVAIVPEFSYPAELFPTELRASGVGLTVTISRLGAGGGVFLLPIISEQFGIWASLWACVVTLIVGGVVCQMWAPETSLQEKMRQRAVKLQAQAQAN